MTPRLLRNSLAKTLGVGLCFLIISCGSKETESGGSADSGAAKGTETADTGAKEANKDAPAGAKDPLAGVDLSDYDTKLDMVTYAWDPQAGDKSVSAEDGGPGFTGEGWLTNMTFPAIGSPDAVKGGTFKMYLPNWPANLRMAGKDYNTSFNYMAIALCQESLINLHPFTNERIPALATHWKISENKDEYTFRINPEARWSDGKEVTSADVVATFNLLMDDRLLFPSNLETYGKFEVPVAHSKYIVSVKVKEESWRNLMYFGGMSLFPAHEISIPGDEYLKEYQNRYTAVSGPYNLDIEDVDLNRSLTLRRRDDWWAKDNPAYMGAYNFDAYNFKIVLDPILAFEMAKKGELDYFTVLRAQWWVEELVPEKVDHIKRGILQKRKFYNDSPQGTSGMGFNMSRAPLDDVRIRKALAMSYNRPEFIDNLFFNEYEPLDSYWQYGDYRNPNNGVLPYDLFGAVKLLKAAGWTEKDDDGIRIKNGKRLTFELSYRSKGSERFLTIYAEDCRKIGVNIELKLLDPAAAWKNMRQREYDIVSTAWGALVFPNPVSSWSSELAAQMDNNNITGFASEEVDALMKDYDKEYDPTKRSEIIRKIDAIVYAAHPYVLGWYGPAQRVIYQNKFKMPKFGVWRTTDDSDMMFSWWIDPEMDKQLEAARKDTSKMLTTLPEKDHFWKAWSKANPN
ncbi:MAG: ABC transporter substrate-binding protein [Planctomycetes bacterium]|nr:ABC transporter substrate-binding protein [Planctomycetota bacterium]